MRERGYTVYTIQYTVSRTVPGEDANNEGGRNGNSLIMRIREKVRHVTEQLVIKPGFHPQSAGYHNGMGVNSKKTRNIKKIIQSATFYLYPKLHSYTRVHQNIHSITVSVVQFLF